MNAITRSPGFRLILAGIPAMMLAVPLFMLYLLVYDRENQAETARASIAQGWGGPQRLAGPVLVLPYKVQTSETVQVNGKAETRTKEEWDELYLAPEALSLDTRVAPERRRRSIHETVVYSAEVRGAARYRLPADLARLNLKPEQIAFDRAELRFGVSDPRGLRAGSSVTVGGTTLAPQPGNGLAATGGAGFFVPVDATSLQAAPLAASFAFGVRGHAQLSLMPRAGQTEWKLTSPWPHPSFVGAFLPDARQVSAQGFTATYRISNLALGATLLARTDLEAPAAAVIATNPYALVRGPDARESTTPEAAVQLVQPVDVYAQINRSVKYGFLFIAFTFLAFLMFDVIGGRRVSPVEYLLVGAGLVLFFVMLLAFAEVMGFLVAYLAASGAIVGLLTAYSAAVLGSWARALLIAALLVALYATMYVLLSLEDYALLVGSLLLFAALAAVMFLTRNLEWGRGGETVAEA
ncbi:cell envelope integrity protein CreD [Sphingomonas sp.]|uniref:cell envelope integrity protein CreD n=1 Tax=Sphingomonas sp. TaxID=28214 RepID=UPI001AFDFA7B|nr:cell envelope integrity protein CreD [Sphingomonas sp.]MBO9714011.1 cell envelope integrity protein CreD [Sphingomonas sp.]